MRCVVYFIVLYARCVFIIIVHQCLRYCVSMKQALSVRADRFKNNAAVWCKSLDGFRVVFRLFGGELMKEFLTFEELNVLFFYLLFFSVV